MNRRNFLKSTASGIALGAMPQAGGPIIIPVPDVTNWQYGAGSRVTQFNGETVGLAGYGSKILVDLGVKPQFGVYTLKFQLANYFYAYPGPYEVAILIGAKEFCSTYGWGIGEFTELTLVCPVSNYFTLYDGFGFDHTQDLGVTLTADGWPLYLRDNVSLTFTPSN